MSVFTVIDSLFTRLCKQLFTCRCLNCAIQVSTEHTLCSKCWNQLHFIAYEQALTTQYDAVRTISILRYKGIAAQLIKRFKYCDDIRLAPFFTNLLYNAAKNYLEGLDIILPVPLHKEKLQLRKYNQIAILAKYLAKKTEKMYLLNALIKKQDSASQSRLTRAERLYNLKDCFSVREDMRHHLYGASILLIDDVYTTGATANECAKALLTIGSSSVLVLTLAKTL